MVVVGVVIGIAGTCLAITLPTSFTSSADVLLNPAPGNALTIDSARSGDQINVAMQTEAGLVKSPAVAKLVSASVGEIVPASNTDLKVTIPPNTQIVRLQYTGESPRTAQLFAAAYADALLSNREDQAKASVSGELDLLEKQAEDATAGLAKAAKGATGAVPPADAVAQVQLYTNRLATIQDQIGSLQVSAVKPGALISPASLPLSADGFPPVVVATAVTILGLLVGAAIAIWAERADDRIRARAEGSVGSVPVMGVVPSGLTGASRGLIGSDGEEMMADAYRGVRAAALSMAGPPSVLAISALEESLEAASGRVAVNLAASIAATQHSVVLVDATLGSGAISRLAGVQSDRGLADALREELDQAPTVQSGAGYSVVSGGQTALTARELLASVHFHRVLHELTERHDYVILAGPPLSVSEGSEVALAAAGLIVVAAERRSERGSVLRVVARATQLGIAVLGLVAVDYQRGEEEAQSVHGRRSRTKFSKVSKSASGEAQVVAG